MTTAVASNQPTLVELAFEAQKLEQLILKTYEQTSGEITPESEELEKAFNEIAANLDKKIDSVHYMMNHFESRAEFYSAMAKKISMAANAIDSNKERLKSMVKYIMEKQELQDLNGQTVRFKLSKSAPSLDVDQEQLTPEWWMETIVRKPNNAKIKEALLADKEVPGARLVHNKTLRSYIGGTK